VNATALAPAKVNLFLHVAPLAADGYHPLASLMAFADVGDRLRLEPAETTGLAVTGAFAGELAGLPAEENLVWRAVSRLLEHAGHPPAPFRLTLDKALPVAAGLGGGSSDAGAALKLARDAFAPDVTDAELEEIAAELGSDGPACLHARTVVARGRGERLSPAPALPPLPAVLVNPRVACSTGRVYRAYDADPRGDADLPALPPQVSDVAETIALLAECRNDLEAPALGVAPEIAGVLERLRAQPEALLVRLSGSGATCFALCASPARAVALAGRLGSEAPGWWVKACTLG
jgi:4-diphosphocytidyl-2-C-methyl-D-erythritol kinase